nr:hypothetical protein [Ardenticatenales bacterium]
MTPAITLEQFAEVVATSEDDQWVHHLIDAVTALVPETKAAALFLQNEQDIRPIAATGKPPSLQLSALQA